MGSPSSGYVPQTAIPRPKPQTYQEQDEQNAQDYWKSQQGWVDSDREQAAGRRDSSASGADAATADFNAWKPQNLQDWSATNLKGYNPTQVAQWLSALPSQSRVGGGGTASVAGSVGGAGSNAPGNTTFQSKELEAFDPSALENFDPSSYGKEFAKGAEGDFKTQLGDQLETLTNQSVGAGRLRTGLFDRDQGRVINRLGEDFNNRLAQAATTFSGQRLSAIQGAEGMRLSRAGDIDANARTIAELNANLGYQTNRDAQANALTSRGQDISEFGAETDRQRLGLSGAEYLDTQGYNRASDLDAYGYKRATGLDESIFNQKKTGLDAALGRETMYNGAYDRSANRSADYATANREWAGSDREAQDTRDAIARARNPWGRRRMAGSGQGSIDANPSVAAATSKVTAGY